MCDIPSGNLPSLPINLLDSSIGQQHLDIEIWASFMLSCPSERRSSVIRKCELVSASTTVDLPETAMHKGGPQVPMMRHRVTRKLNTRDTEIAAGGSAPRYAIDLGYRSEKPWWRDIEVDGSFNALQLADYQENDDYKRGSCGKRPTRPRNEFRSRSDKTKR